MKIMWCVMSGVDESHMHDISWFKRFKDAKNYAQNLKLTPTGHRRPFVIERWEYEKSFVYGDICRSRLVVNTTARKDGKTLI